MKINLFGLPKRALALAVVLALALTLSFSGIAGATAAPAAKGASVTPSPLCITATPPSQTVGVGQLARVLVTVSCYPVSTTLQYSVVVAWGDGKVSAYPICGPACVPPSPPMVQATHAYQGVGLYQPKICVVPSPTSVVSSPYCTSVQIQVIQLA